MSETPDPGSNSTLLDSLYPTPERMVALPANGPSGDSDSEPLRLLEVSWTIEMRSEQGEARRVGAVAHVGPEENPSQTLSRLKDWVDDQMTQDLWQGSAFDAESNTLRNLLTLEVQAHKASRRALHMARVQISRLNRTIDRTNPADLG